MQNADRRQQHEARYRPYFVAREKIRDIQIQINLFILFQVVTLIMIIFDRRDNET